MRVFTAREIDAAAAPDRVDQLFEFVPNVQLGSGGEAPAIRGQDATGVLRDLPGFLGGARPRATLQIDGRAITYSEFAFGVASVWDVERVEIFRSPQTTTQGRNSIGGAIFIHTADPTFSPEIRARAIAGEARTRQLSAAVSGPLLGDRVAVRLSGDFRLSRTSSDLRGLISDVNLNRDDYGLVRAKLLAEPPLLPGSKLLLTYAHVESAMPQIEGVRRPFDERRDPRVTYGYFSTNVDSITAELSVPISRKLESRTIVTGGKGAIRRFAPAGFGETRNHGRDRSLESILEWTDSNRLRAIGGVHLAVTRLDQAINLSAAALGTGEFEDAQGSAGLFGEIQWRASDRMTVTGGLRYQSDSQKRTGALSRNSGAISLDYDERSEALLPKLSVAYDLMPAVRAGLMVQRAYNPGGVTLSLRTREPDTFEPERLWNYELFVRASALGGAVTLTANAFYNDIEDAQRSQLRAFPTLGGTVFFAEIDNAPKARSYGGELELEWRATDRLSLRGGLGLLETKIVRTLTQSDPILGKAFARSPQVSAAAALDWRPIDAISISSQLRHNSGYFSDDSETLERRVSRSTKLDAKVSWRRRPFTLFGYARNLLDSFYLTYLFSPQTRTANDLATAADPREVGIGIEANF